MANKKFNIILKISWIFLNLYFSYKWLISDNLSIISPDAEYLSNLILLTFPFGLLLSIFIGLMLEIILMLLPNNYIFIEYTEIVRLVICAIANVFMIIGGYYQWFIFVPNLIKKIILKDKLNTEKKLFELNLKNEERIVKLIAIGYSNEEIKKELNISNDENINKLREIIIRKS